MFFLSDSVNHDKYAVVVILSEFLNDFKLGHPSIQFENTTLQSDGTAKHFKQRYTLSWMTTLKDSDAWAFSVTSHGKGDIDGIGGTCNRHVREKIKSRLVFQKNSVEFSETAAEICPNINVMHYSKEKIQSEKEINLGIPFPIFQEQEDSISLKRSMKMSQGYNPFLLILMIIRFLI